ncbi:sensor histidine kinase [Sinomicrobium weinanense]|uniref:histidine kinase n=1 Tax=Sinomicrobium weinanense TaxID=2842200 RepID=A0A926JSP7_9FLAO|nr:ATP-binding protein [Sinomicrobium weinanense]MBC9796817.1 sensor histidine kinase [Sinomicrobium weinanense]MBU3123679.1 sensor histidine kinase [Sinomicrobium weinanense]
METAEKKLKERIKELTCLYEVTSIIVNCDYDRPEISLDAIGHCLKKAWQFEDDTNVVMKIGDYTFTEIVSPGERISIRAGIRVFNKEEGFIEVGYPAEKYTLSDFLDEEKRLLDNVGLEVGNLLERKRIRESELAIKRQMERADRLSILGEITAGIAHELNTPLTNILGFAELLEGRMTGREETDDLHKIRESAIFCREVVKKLMFFTCEVPQMMKPVALKPIVENVLQLLKPTFQNRQLTHHINFSDEKTELKADEIQITQVLFNLIMNAVYYSPEHGSIDIDVNEGEDAITIEIADQGKGIPENVGDRIFEPFFTTKPTGEGSGLGLSVVHGIISGHGGHIFHRPRKEGGTVFVINFPKKPTE